MITAKNFNYIKENFRFYTKEEMLKKFGDNWRYFHSTAFIEEMDYLLGKSLRDVNLTQVTSDGIENIFARVDGKYYIATCMITKKEINNSMNFEKAVKDIQERVNKIFSPNYDIKCVHFDDNKKTVTVVLKDGRVGVSRCNDEDVYDQRVGFCIAYTNAVFGSRNQVTKLIQHYNGEEAKRTEERNLRNEILREIRLEEYKKKVAESAERRNAIKAEMRKKIEEELSKNK